MYQNILLPSRWFFFCLSQVILGSRNTKYFNLRIEAKWSYRRLCSLIGILMSPYLKPQMNFRRWNQTKGEVYRRSCLQEPPSGLLSSWYPGRNSKYILCNKEFWWGRRWYNPSGLVCASWVASRRDLERLSVLEEQSQF